MQAMATSFELQSSSGHMRSVKRMAYSFDGQGNFTSKEWDLGLTDRRPHGEKFSWYHVELPRSHTSLVSAAQCLISALCPPLKLQDILALSSNGPFCGHVDGALIFRCNSSGPTTSEYTQKLAGRVTEDSVITVSLGRIPRLEFSTVLRGSFLSEIPAVEGNDTEPDRFVIQQHVLEFYLARNHIEDVNHRIPMSVINLVVHIIDTHIDHLQDILTRLEMDLDENEHELDTGGYVVKQQMLGNRLFPRMQLNLQRLLQVVSHGEQVFPRFKDKVVARNWCSVDELEAIQMLVSRLHKQKENVGFLASRMAALQAGLDTWQSEQINRKLYYLSFLSIIFLPLSIVTSGTPVFPSELRFTVLFALCVISDGYKQTTGACKIIG
ncbi:hypothetical protein KP509_04G006900 [Ceratopteris richardii]|uniref:Uncharacterized protein n=1 Tax=Ceratopteris richardii TaxID=49495 RepID=A0A8T2UPX5_CERRI|nr:hypothetical protein KP509_04G006900 [Ceratopteris richardii]